MPNVGDIIKASDLQDLLEQINNSSNNIVGELKYLSFDTIPQNCLMCDGSEISRDTYSELFNVIGTIYGEGDSVTTFNLPDLRDQWILCAGTTHETGEAVEEGLPNITGYFTSMRQNIGGAFHMDTGITAACISTSIGLGNSFGMTRLNASRSSAVYGGSDHVTPKSIVLMPCIIYE